VWGRALSGATWAPVYITYGDNNRHAPWCALWFAGAAFARWPAIRISPPSASRCRWMA
jgi:hypothetical protein